MLLSEPFLSNRTPAFKLLILILIIIASTLFTMLLGIVILVPFYGTGILDKLSAAASMAKVEDITILKFMQVVNQIGIFIIPAIFFAYLENRNIPQYLKLNKAPLFVSVIISAIVVFTFLPFTHWLVDINQNMRLPEFLGSIERWMKDSEESAAKLTEAFLKTDSFPGLFTNIIIVGVLAAIGEELLFRSVLIRLFDSWFKNVHLAVLFSALLFSAFHLQFYGFLPRFMLGVLFGYLFVWSGTVWLPILAHFLNNGSAVVVYFLFNTGKMATDADQFGATDNWIKIVISTLVSIILLAGIYFFEKKKAEETMIDNIHEPG
jgi:hypothetical protein